MGDDGTRDGWKRDVYITEEHLHPYTGEIWTPTSADNLVIPAGLQLQSAGGGVAGSFGVWVQVLAATPATRRTDFHRCLVVAASADEEYEIEIGIGAAGFEVVQTRFPVIYDSTGGLSLRMAFDSFCPRIAPGTRVAARCRNRTANQRTIDVRFGYHEYTAGL
jgi:hypothetical protein